MDEFGVSQEVLDRVARERQRRKTRALAASSSAGSASNLAEFIGELAIALSAAVAAAVVGGTCIGLPVMAATKSDEGVKLSAVLAGLVVGITCFFYRVILPTLWKGLKWRSPVTPVAAGVSSDAFVSGQEIARAEAYEAALTEWRKFSWSRWSAMSGTQFEHEFARLLSDAGWRVKVTKASGDGGIDLTGRAPNGKQVLIQCKWWANPCGVKVVRELAGVVAVEREQKVGIVVCKGGFTKDASAFAKSAGLLTWSSAEVKALLSGADDARTRLQP
jgi:hypothetical protein